MTVDFSNRYSRQTLFRPIGPDGQKKLQSARVAVVGMGALGTVSASLLARAGVGYLRLIDRDIIEPSNLQRQSLFDEADAVNHRAKAEAAAAKLGLANSDIQIEWAIADLSWRNAHDLLGDVDVIVDGTDNFEVRYLINEVAVDRGLPWSYGGAVSSYGTTAFIEPGETPCLVCLFGEHQGGGHDTCDTVGVIAPAVSMIASLQVTEVLKYLTDNEAVMTRGVTTLDVWRNEFRTVKFAGQNPECPCCVQRRFPMLSAKAEALTVSLCGRQTIQVKPEHAVDFSLSAVAQRLKEVAEVRFNANLLRCDFGEIQITLFADGRALLHGVDNPQRARSLYAQYIGN